MGVLNVFSRSPSSIAMAVASLDMASNGRAILGLGVSSPPLVEYWHGMKFQRPITRLREYTAIVRKILSGSRVDFQGREFNLKHFKLAFDPPRKDIPLYVAALGERMYRLAGELGDGVLLFFHPKSHIPKAMSEVESGANTAGKEGRKVDIACIIGCFASKDKDAARRTAKMAVAQYIGGMGPFYPKLISSCGFEREVSLVTEAWRAGRREEASGHVSDNLLDELCVVGTVDECRASIEEYLSLGIDLPILGFPTAQPNLKEWTKEAVKVYSRL
jgi:alkanesulfonate monooxygenase SsuD/methylene tetrahydromethanopterin reductase-like flavin-dependent oxidoreductase (luciferase family)